VIVLVLAIGVLNLCLGYAVAVHLGYGPPGILETWESLMVEPPGGLGQAAMGDLPAQQPTEDAVEPPATDNPQNWQLDDQFIERTILNLNVAMINSGNRTTQIEARLREHRGDTDAAMLRECLALFKEDCETYLIEQAEQSEMFCSRIGELGELGALGKEIETANQQQAAQIETALSNLGLIDIESDLEAAGEWLLEEIGNLRLARHKLRDNQQIAFLTIARYDDRFDRIEPRMCADGLTKMYNRIGLETTLRQWWQEGRHKSQQINAALFDLDAFGELNHQHGAPVGDRVLCHFAQLVQEYLGKDDLAGRFAGQQFLVLMPDVGSDNALKIVELIRQSIENSPLSLDRQEIHQTVTAAVTEVAPDDTEETLFQKLEETLKQAKQDGPNRSLVYREFT